MSSFFCCGNKNTKKKITKILLSFFCFLFSFLSIINPVIINNVPAKSCSVANGACFPNFQQIMRQLFGNNNVETNTSKHDIVYLGGYPLGFTINCEGVLVIAISNNSAENVVEGDIIKKIEDKRINSSMQISEIVNDKDFKNKNLKLTIDRNGDEVIGYIKPIFDKLTNKFKLGLWIRDNAAGVGTLTYVKKDNLRFAALGHPVCDIDTGSMMPVLSGNIFKCNIVGYKRGLRGNPGELKGLFLRGGSMFGTLDTNNKFGVYGYFSEKYVDILKQNEIEVAHKNEVKSGKAKIRCTIDGFEPKDYDIEIVKTYFQSTKDNKSMFIRVTDKELLEKTGGIVQGMSGSPIIQNGRLVGAVTHVFVSDPTKGYGVYADWMMDN